MGRNVAKLFFAVLSMFFLLRDGPRLMREARAILEGILGPRVHDYLDAIGATTQAVVYALILGAIAQGAVAGIGYWIFGVEAPALMGAVTVLIALIPFGAPFVWGSLSFWMLVTGNVWQGVGLLLWGVLLVSWMDNIVRPLVISNATRMPFLLVVFGVLGGVLAFGLVGLFIGPVLLAVSLAIWREWLEEHQQKEERRASALGLTAPIRTACYWLSGWALLGLRQQDLVDAHAVHVHDLDLQVAPRQRVAGLGNAAEPRQHEARDGVIVAADHVAAVQAPLQLFDRQMTVDQPRAVLALHGFRPLAAAERRAARRRSL